MNADFIRPIPKYMLKRIAQTDKEKYPVQDGHTRFYSYLTRFGKELFKVTVAVKNHYKKWLCKQVAAHAIHSDRCFAKDIVRYRIWGYVVDWSVEIPRRRVYYTNHSWCWINPDEFEPYSILINKEFVGTMPQYKYSGYEHLYGDRILDFLRKYDQYPVIEFLMKFGFSDFWNSKQICEKATKDKAFRKWLIQNRDKIASHYYVSAILTAYRDKTDVCQQQEIERTKKKMRGVEYKDLRKAFHGEQKKLLTYLLKQGTEIEIYKDYYEACVELGLDMGEDKNRYPHDFKYWHDMRVDQRNTKRAEEDKRKRAELYAKFSAVIEKYLPLERMKKEGYVVIIAHSPAELIHEGEVLGHCVGKMNYDQKVARGQSLIFFVRRADKIDEPFFTMEYSLEQRKILQLYGAGNRHPEPEIEAYIHKKWLPYANRKMRQIAA